MKAAIFITCLCDSFYPEVGQSMVNVLQKCGVELEFPPEQVCCGQPAFNTGYWDEAREVARTTLKAFKDSEYVIAPSGSCVAMIKEFYPVIFEKYPEDRALANNLVGKIYEFTQFMVNVLKVTDVGARFPHTVTYHPNCHANRMLGVNPCVEKLLEDVKELKYIELPDAHDCCGFGGTFSVKMPEISESMVTEKASHVLETGAEFLTGTDLGCLMNIGGKMEKEGYPVRVRHIAQILDEGMKL